MDGRHPHPGEEIADLADGVDVNPLVVQLVEVGACGRSNREIAACAPLMISRARAQSS
jgi:hypothetical protein